jgi:hypothetical protein
MRRDRVAPGGEPVHPGAMESADSARPVHVGALADGALTYLVDVPPEALPPVLLRDLAAAWEAAREAAIAARWSTIRRFRFRCGDGTCTDLALADADACCWAGAVDGTVGMHTRYGLSLCLRLLALVDLLTHASWAVHLFSLRHGGAQIDPCVLHAAATVPLTREARFDESGFRARMQQRFPAAPATHLTPGGCA